MIYLLTLAGKEHRAEVVEIGSGRYGIRLDGGQATHVSARHTEGSIFSIILGEDGGVSYEADVDVGPETVRVAIRGEVFEVGAIDERRKRLRAAAAGGAIGDSIHSPMPGKVVKLLVVVGAQVKKGQGVAVVEAMKMENELVAAKDGVVKQITVTEGQAVVGGALLLVIE